MNDVESVLRSLPTLSLRYLRRKTRPCRRIAAWASPAGGAPRLAPAVAGSPGREHWAKLTRSRRPGDAGNDPFDSAVEDRCLRGQLAALPASAGLGWAGQPGRAYRVNGLRKFHSL